MKLTLTARVVAGALFLWVWSKRSRDRARRASYYPPPGEGTDADVERFIRKGRRLTAVKLYREIHSVDHEAAREAVERMADKIGRREQGGSE